jgi:hypothetical protein
MRSRQPVGYVVKIDGAEVALNLLDLHRGQVASHALGVASVTETGSLMALDGGSRLLVMRVLSLSFVEPREAHRAGIGTSAHQGEPLRELSGFVVGRLQRRDTVIEFIPDSLPTPPLGAEAFPLTPDELAAVLRQGDSQRPQIILGEDLRGGGQLRVGLQELIAGHVAVLGGSGQGKSCLTSAVLQQIVRLPRSRVVVFDINGEYQPALDMPDLPDGAVKVTQLGGAGDDKLRIPYYALGRAGLQRLLMPSDKTQRPALNFALDHLNKVEWFGQEKGAGLWADDAPSLFDDCRSEGAQAAADSVRALRDGTAQAADHWPPMVALAALVAESHALQRSSRPPNPMERNAFNYSNVAPLISRIQRLAEDEMFQDVVDVDGGVSAGADPLSWRAESSHLVEQVFGGEQEDWRLHIIDLRRVSHDLMPLVLGSLLELFAYELFRRGQDNKIATLLVLEEAHHYLRPTGTGEEATQNALAYERLAKEGRKFGLALWLSTQRPSEISPTVIAQCSHWIAFRLTSDADLATVQSASEWADRRDVRRIAGLPRQTAIVFGRAIAMPTLIRAHTADPTPNSNDGAFEGWA